MTKATIADVAREAGVSISTVSRVLNGNYPVSQRTKARVETAAKKLDFIPNSLARGLVIKHTMMVGVITSNITNMYFSAIISGIQSYFKEKGYMIVICNTEGSPAQEEEYLNQLIRRQVDGIISIDPRTASVKNGIYEKVAQDLPLVLINGCHEGIRLNYVLSDQAGGTVSALSYLYGLGHKNIGFVRGGPSYSYDVKETVYREFLGNHGLPVKEDYIIGLTGKEPTQLMGEAACCVKGLLAQSPKITAVFACNDWMGAGIIRGAVAMGLHVPEALSVVGYDNIVISQITMPRLTTVDQNMISLGEAASQQLFALFDTGDKKGYIRYTLDTKLVLGESCAPPRNI